MSTAILHLIGKLTTPLYVPQITKTLKRPRNIHPKWVKRMKVTKLVFCIFFLLTWIIFYIKPTCFKKHLQEQSGFYVLILILPKFLKLKKVWFLYHTSLCFGF